MTRAIWFYSVISSLWLFAAQGLAEETKANKPPAGLRVAYTLMSNGAEMEAIVKAANISDHKQANAPYFGRGTAMSAAAGTASRRRPRSSSPPATSTRSRSRRGRGRRTAKPGTNTSSLTRPSPVPPNWA